MRRKGRPASKPPRDIDVALGVRIKELRDKAEPRMTQVQLGKKLNVTFQQIQKYENGRTRISVARLYQISSVFNITPMEFLASIP
jgi:transcriptional regulator with XRE-family HTH domain